MDNNEPDDDTEPLTKSKSKIVFTNLLRNDPARRCPDVTKLKALGWKPRIALYQGILSMKIDIKKPELSKDMVLAG